MQIYYVKSKKVYASSLDNTKNKNKHHARISSVVKNQITKANKKARSILFERAFFDP